MDKKYLELFKEMTKATAVSAEQVMDYNHEHEDENGFENAKKLRDEYEALREKIEQAGDDYLPDKDDCSKFLVATLVLVNQLQERIKLLGAAISGYQNEMVPKLQQIAEAEDDEAARKLASEIFVIKEEE